MSFINEQSKEINCKVVYFGPALGGKSTSLRAVYDQVKVGKKGELVSLSTADERTLFFDFLPLNLGTVKDYTIRMHLYTIPGQVAYDAQRKLIAKGTDGIVFVADSQLSRMEANLASMEELQGILEEELGDTEEFPFVIQYNKRDIGKAMPVEEMRGLLNPKQYPDFETVATDGNGVFDALQSILKGVLEDLR